MTLKTGLREAYMKNAAFSRFLMREGLKLVIVHVKEPSLDYIELQLRKGKDIASYLQMWMYHPPEEIRLKKYARPRVVDVYIKRIETYTPYRGKGYAAMLLRTLVPWLDAKHLVAFLDVESLSEKMPGRALIKFYKSAGFVVLDKDKKGELAAMERRPKT